MRAASGGELQIDGFELAVDELTGGREQRDLRPRRAEIDGQNLFGRSRPRSRSRTAQAVAEEAALRPGVGVVVVGNVAHVVVDVVLEGEMLGNN